jgi:hypothetical protein
MVRWCMNRTELEERYCDVAEVGSHEGPGQNTNTIVTDVLNRRVKRDGSYPNRFR